MRALSLGLALTVVGRVGAIYGPAARKEGVIVATGKTFKEEVLGTECGMSAAINIQQSDGVRRSGGYSTACSGSALMTTIGVTVDGKVVVGR